MITAAIVGPGNIGTDLLVKLQRVDDIDVRYMIGVDPQSDGLARARELGVQTSAGGVAWLLDQPEVPDLVFEATSAGAHTHHAPAYASAGVTAIDLTPAAVGPFICPVVNLGEHIGAPNINMITCGGQATIPIVHAVSRVTPVSYAEIIASISSRSAGPGTRANIDEFTETTSHAVQTIGGAQRGKAIIILNPVDPPMIMRDTVFCAISPDADRDAITDSVHDGRVRGAAVRPRISTGGRPPVRRPAARVERPGAGCRCSSRFAATATTCRRGRATSTS